MEDSVFTKIIKGEIPSHKVYEDESVIAILDIHPVNPGHILVIPKEQIDEFQDLGGNMYEHCMAVAQQVARKIKSELSPVRVGVMVLGFDVPHAHIHLIPLNEPKEIAYESLRSAQEQEPDHDELARVAKRLKLD